MQPDAKKADTPHDPDIRIEEDPVSSLLAHYSMFEETLGMNTARGVVVPSRVPRSGPMRRLPLHRESQDAPSHDETGSSGLPHPGRHFPPLVAVIPAYNEELTIGTVVLAARPHVGRVIVVDDGSTDRTARIAELAGAEVIRNPTN
ncbi:MAG: glycosyltransferase, partial [Methanolinea sp.]